MTSCSVLILCLTHHLAPWAVIVVPQAGCLTSRAALSWTEGLHNAVVVVHMQRKGARMLLHDFGVAAALRQQSSAE